MCKKCTINYTHFTTHGIHSDHFTLFFFFLKMPVWVFWYFCSSGSRIKEAAVEIINETFDGILGANSRGSSSYSACRPIQRGRKLKSISRDIWVKHTDFVYPVQMRPTKRRCRGVNPKITWGPHAIVVQFEWGFICFHLYLLHWFVLCLYV